MALLWFVLDLSSLSPPLLRDLKQCLRQLANLYAISSPPFRNRSEPLGDRIGLCYVSRPRVSLFSELRVAYSPLGSFSLREFHYAVNSLPDDSFSPAINDAGSAPDWKLSSVLSDHVLYAGGDSDKDVMRKVIILSSYVADAIDSETRRTLMDAADRCILVEFLVLEPSSSHLVNMQENVNTFSRSLSDLDNCSFHAYLPDTRVLHGLVKRWLKDLKDDVDEPIQAHFIFKSNLFGSLNQMHCSLSMSVSQIVDGFDSCKACRCHGFQLNDGALDRAKEPSCPVSSEDLELSEVMEHSVKVGEKTILFMPSFQKTTDLLRISSPISFNVIERTNLGSLSEGVMAGWSYFVTPLACHESSSEDIDHSEINSKRFRGFLNFVVVNGYAVFQGICHALFSMDQGLVCSSYCNLEAMKQTAFQYFFILQPSENGPMLLRRLAGSEEVLPTPDLSQYTTTSVSMEIQSSIQASLSEMDLKGYNPIEHERGFHQKLTSLVKDSIQFGSVPHKPKEVALQVDSGGCDCSEAGASTDVVVVESGTPVLDKGEGTDRITACIAEEWEQLVVNEIPRTFSPTPTLNPNSNRVVLSPADGDKQLDEKTSRILERLEVPKQLKRKALSPIITVKGISEAKVAMKRPLILAQPTQPIEQLVISSQLMKPNFQKLKRKHK